MTDSTEESRVLTLVFTDLADSTALKTEHGDRVVHDMIEAHREHVTRLAEECAGRIIDWAGDGCFLTFETSSAGVMFSLRLQQVHADDEGLPGVRIGIHMGEVTEGQGPQGPDGPPRIDGLAVDIAARVSGLAQPGQVLMSSSVYNSTRQRLGVETFGQPILWQAHGTYELKGFDEPFLIGEAGLEGVAPMVAPKSSEKAKLIQRAKRKPGRSSSMTSRPGMRVWAIGLIAVLLVAVVFMLTRRSAPGDDSGPGSVDIDSLGPITSLAVLPLDNLMNDPEQDWFVEGMTRSIASELSKISSLKVISTTSTARYKETLLSMPEIAAELKVRGLIQGTVLRDGNEIRITVDLIDGDIGELIWTGNYDNTFENVLQIHSDVALDIAEQIRATITPDERERVARAPVVIPQAMEAYLRGRTLWQSRSKRDLERAVEHFQRAIDIDETFAPAHAGLADAYNMLSTYEYVPASEVFAIAKKSALRAIELDAFLAEGYATLGWTLLAYEGDWEGSQAAYEMGISLDPNYATGHLWYGWFLLGSGRSEEARREFEKAIELDPHALKGPDSLATVSWVERDYEDAIRRELEVLEVDPNFLPALERLVLAYRSSGQLEKALEATEKIIALRNNDTFSLIFKAIILVDFGRLDEAKYLLNDVAIEKSKWAPLYYTALGDTERALNLLRSQNAQNLYRNDLATTPLWDPLRGDDRYWQLVGEMNHPKVPPGHPNYDQQQAWLARKAAAEEAVDSSP